MAREKAPQDVNDKAQRRVYVLPNDLVERITAYQQELGLSSEVEAVRRLLDGALKERDNPPSIVARLIAQLKNVRSLRDAARDVLVEHPLISSLSFDKHSLRFELKNGYTAEVTIHGYATIWDSDNNLYDFGWDEPPEWASFDHKQKWKNRPILGKQPEIDDDIPF